MKVYGNKTYKDYSIKELQILLNIAKSEYKRTGIKEYYDIYTKLHSRLIEVHSYINGSPKLIEKKSNNFIINEDVLKGIIIGVILLFIFTLLFV